MKLTSQYKLLVLDLDGTLTNSKKEISTRNKEVLMKAQMMGVKVVLASGRPTGGIGFLAEELCLHRFGGYILSYNGGQIIECASGNLLFQSSIPVSAIPDIYQAAVDYSLAIVSYDDNNIVTQNQDDEFVKIEAWLNRMGVVETDDFGNFFSSDVPKCLMMGDPLHLDRVEPQIADRFPHLNVMRSIPFFLEVVPQGVDKALSLSRLLGHLGYTPEQMMVCGDGMNDLSMIEYAGLGVAMNNAEEKVKNASSYITLSNDEDGVAHAVERFIFGLHQN